MKNTTDQQSKVSYQQLIPLIILQGVVALTLVLGSVFTTYLLLNKQEIQVFDIEEYVYIDTFGLGEQAALHVVIDRDSLLEEQERMGASDAKLRYIEGLSFYYQDCQIGASYPAPVCTATVQLGALLEITVKDTNNLGSIYRMDLVRDTFQQEVRDIGVQLTQIDEVSQDNIDNLQAINVELELFDDYVATAVVAGEHIVTYYKIEDTYQLTRSKESTETSALTILYGYLYQEKVYFVGETNMLLYVGAADEVLWGDTYFDSDLELSDIQRNVDAVSEILQQRGFSVLERSERVSYL